MGPGPAAVTGFSSTAPSAKCFRLPVELSPLPRLRVPSPFFSLLAKPHFRECKTTDARALPLLAHSSAWSLCSCLVLNMYASKSAQRRIGCHLYLQSSGYHLLGLFCHVSLPLLACWPRAHSSHLAPKNSSASYLHKGPPPPPLLEVALRSGTSPCLTSQEEEASHRASLFRPCADEPGVAQGLFSSERRVGLGA